MDRSLAQTTAGSTIDAAVAETSVALEGAALPRKRRHVRTGPHRKWTTKEDERLRALWRTVSSADLRKSFPNRSLDAVLSHAERLKLPLGQHKSTVSLHALSKRAGYSPERLRRILEWAGVAIEPYVFSGKPRSNRKRAAHPWRYMINEAASLEAIVKWEQTAETIQVAAARVCAEWRVLARWLKASGVEHTTGDRYLPAQIDAVVARYRTKGLYLCHVAAQTGVPEDELRALLGGLGLLAKLARGRKPKTLDPSVSMDRVRTIVREHRARATA